jgi:hypothetical protein
MQLSRDKPPASQEERLFSESRNMREEAEDLGTCASTPRTKWLPAFHVKRGPEGTRSFDYSHMALKLYDDSGTRFTIEFYEPEGWRMVVHGRNLWIIYNYLVQHRLEYIAEIDRDFEDGDKPVITRIDIDSLKDGAEARPFPVTAENGRR